MSGRRGSRLCASWRDFATVLSRRDRCRRRLLLDHRFRSGVGERKVEVETRPLADPAGHVDLAIALVYQTVDHRQTQSRALALVLGGVERLEDAVEGLSSIPLPLSAIRRRTYAPGSRLRKRLVSGRSRARAAVSISFPPEPLIPPCASISRPNFLC